MKMKFGVYVILAGLLAGCTAVDDLARTGQTVDDIVTLYGDDIITIYGDDIINNADTLIGTPILQAQNEMARTTTTYLDELLRTRTASDEIADLATWVAQSPDDIPQSSLSALVDDSAPIVLYQSTNRISPLQAKVINYLAVKNDLPDDQAELMLQTICFITDYINTMGQYPSTDYGLFYLNLHVALNQIQPEVLAVRELAQKSLNYAIAWIESPNLSAETIQEGAQLISSGICMIESMSQE